MPSSRQATRLALTYVAIFGWLGAYLPYAPIWLSAQGMSSIQIGVLLGTAPWTRLVASPLAGRAADHSGRPDRLIQVLALLLLGALSCLWWVRGFWGLLLVMGLAGFCYAPLNPLTDSMTVSAEARGRLRYGPVRLWGSVAFIVCSWLGGQLLESHGAPVVLWSMLTLAGLIVLITLGLPRPDPADSLTPDQELGGPSSLPPSATDSTDSSSDLDAHSLDAPTAATSPSRSSTPLLGMLIVAALLHGSHGVLFVVATPHWLAQGIDEGTVGMLWALGVMAEIVLFALGTRIDRRVSSRSLWVIAGLAGIVRWGLLASTAALPWLVVAQALHALTFGALHLGAMAFIRRHVHPSLRARATTSYAAVGTGLAFGIAMPLAGVLYEHLGGSAYWVMAGCSLTGTLLALWVGRSPSDARP